MILRVVAKYEKCPRRKRTQLPYVKWLLYFDVLLVCSITPKAQNVLALFRGVAGKLALFATSDGISLLCRFVFLSSSDQKGYLGVGCEIAFLLRYIQIWNLLQSETLNATLEGHGNEMRDWKYWGRLNPTTSLHRVYEADKHGSIGCTLERQLYDR